MFDYSVTEKSTIDQMLEPKLAWSKAKEDEIRQLSLDATRLMSCTDKRLTDYRNQGFFKRCWYKLCDKQGEIQRANDKDLVGMQKVGWRFISLLQERDLLMAHSLISIKNNLMTLAISDEETKKEINRMAQKIYDRFVKLEDRVTKLEITSAMHGWLLTLDTYDYDIKFPPHMRILKIVKEFYDIKRGDWNIREIRCLHKALKIMDVPWKAEITLSNFIDNLIDEIDQLSFEEYSDLLLSVDDENLIKIPESFILENIAVPSFASLYKISENYTNSSIIIDELSEALNISKRDALKRAIKSFILKSGIDLTISIPVKDLCVELLDCMNLANNLYVVDNNEIRHSLPMKAKYANINTPISVLKSKAESGDCEAKFQLGKYFYFGDDLVERDFKKALEYMLEAAEIGHPEAQNLVGIMLIKGDAVKKNEETAFQWFKKSADNDCVPGQYNIALCYKHGIGTNKQVNESMTSYYLNTVIDKIPEAVYQLVKEYYSPQDLDKAKTLLSHHIDKFNLFAAAISSFIENNFNSVNDLFKKIYIRNCNMTKSKVEYINKSFGSPVSENAFLLYEDFGFTTGKIHFVITKDLDLITKEKSGSIKDYSEGRLNEFKLLENNSAIRKSLYNFTKLSNLFFETKKVEGITFTDGILTVE